MITLEDIVKKYSIDTMEKVCHGMSLVTNGLPSNSWVIGHQKEYDHSKGRDSKHICVVRGDNDRGIYMLIERSLKHEDLQAIWDRLEDVHSTDRIRISRIGNIE